MDYFTYITGIATLIGFALQIFDALPSYRTYRQKLFYLLLGLFIGNLVTAFDGAKISFSFEVSGHVLLVALISTVITWCLYVAKNTHRDEFFVASGFGAMILLIVLAVGNIPRSDDDFAKLTISELLQLSESSLQENDFDRAIKHQEMALIKVSSKDVRYPVIESNIEKIKKMQVGGI